MRRLIGRVAISTILFLVGGVLSIVVGGESMAEAAVTPGWECVPTTAGQAVVSGGTAPSPSCAAGTTAVLAPTFVSSGIGGKPTVEFSGLNVQIVSGSGSTSGQVNGEGNLIIGYDENTSQLPQTGSHNLVVGSGDAWTSYGGIIDGFGNWSTGGYNLVAGARNLATGPYSTVTGGFYNTASGGFSAVDGGCDNAAGTRAPQTGSCVAGVQTVLGGAQNIASGLESTISGGKANKSQGTASSILGGDANTAASNCQSIPAVPGSC